MARPVLLLLLAVSALAAADDAWVLPRETAAFRPGPGAALAQGQCLVCHSADYVSTQPRLNRAQWLASVEKMRTKYGAPVPTNSIPALVEYLVKTYGDEAAR